MCFTLPLQVCRQIKSKAIMEDGRSVNVSLIGSVKKGDWLLVQSNFAVQKLSEKEAQLVRSTIKEVSSELKI